MFIINVFLSNYSSESGIANGESALQDDIFNRALAKSGTQLDTEEINSNSIHSDIQK